MYELFDYKYILKYICFLKKGLKNCAQKYLEKMPCKKLQIAPGPSVDHVYMHRNFTLPTFLIGT